MYFDERQKSYLPVITNPRRISSSSDHRRLNEDLLKGRLSTELIQNENERCVLDANMNRARLKQSISLPVVQPTLPNDRTCEHKKPDKHSEKGDLVIIQLWADEGNLHDRIHSDEQAKKCSVSNGVPSPSQQRRQEMKVSVPKANQQKSLSPMMQRAVSPNSVKRYRNEDSSVKSGFTQADLKCHNERERQKTPYIFTEQEQSRKIVRQWLEALNQTY